ncbi:hypothetical protein RKH52_004553 [Salmonella enterica]|nr:hypothetical protein [Salmonella enterica]ELD9540455.1 hypothetical protein [Salmonella enterica]
MKYIFALGVDILVLVSIIMGFHFGNESLLNIPHFIGWFVGIVNLLAHLSKKSKEGMAKKYQLQPLLFRIYDVLTDVIFVSFCAYQGWMFMAAVYATAACLKAEFKHSMEKTYAKVD